MSRKQKIIVSITGIFLVLMILVGLTYAYFLTKITGNTNTKSISVTTANLVLEYGENTNVVQGISNAEPGYSVEKIFTATNKGNSTVTYGAVLENIVNGLTRQQDLVYTLTCTSYLKEGFSLASNGTITGTLDGTCNGVPTEKQFSSTSTMSVMTTNTIDTTHTHAYKLTVTYKEMGVDQSTDMNKTFSAKVNIIDTNALTMNNPYKNDTGTLKKTIIDNAMLSLNETEFLETPKTKPAEEISGIKYYTDKVDENTSEYNIPINTTYQGYYWTYGTGYTIDGTGKFTLTGVSTCKYNDGICNATLVGKYLVSYFASDNSSSTDTKRATTNLSNIYKVTKAPASSTSTITMKYKLISSISYSIDEKELSTAPDDYGTSYYYRGGVEDNYVNFAGMCWRIVRIEGDGATKLILEDKNVECNNKSYTGDWRNDNTKKLEENMIDSEFDELWYIFQMDNLTSVLNKLKIDEWCYDAADEIDETPVNNVFYSEAYKRIVNDKKATFKCQGRKLTHYPNDVEDMYVGTLTADEVIYSGLIFDESGQSNASYLLNKYNSSPWYTFTAFGKSLFDDVYQEELFSIAFSELSAGYYDYFRPAVTLLPSVQISKGDGTISNPYVIQ